MVRKRRLETFPMEITKGARKGKIVYVLVGSGEVCVRGRFLSLPYVIIYSHSRPTCRTKAVKIKKRFLKNV